MKFHHAPFLIRYPPLHDLICPYIFETTAFYDFLKAWCKITLTNSTRCSFLHGGRWGRGGGGWVTREITVWRSVSLSTCSHAFQFFLRGNDRRRLLRYGVLFLLFLPTHVRRPHPNCRWEKGWTSLLSLIQRSGLNCKGSLKYFSERAVA